VLRCSAFMLRQQTSAWQVVARRSAVAVYQVYVRSSAVVCALFTTSNAVCCHGAAPPDVAKPIVRLRALSPPLFASFSPCLRSVLFMPGRVRKARSAMEWMVKIPQSCPCARPE